MHEAVNAKPSLPPADPGIKAIVAALQARHELGLPVQTKLELAELLGLTKQAVSRWTRVPAQYVLTIEEAIKVPRRVIRPDLYGQPRKSDLRDRYRRR